MPGLAPAQANTIVETALAKACAPNARPLAVAVLDDAGHVKARSARTAPTCSATTSPSARRGPPSAWVDRDGNVLGSTSDSGGTGDEDEAVCIAGVEAAGLTWG